MLHGEIFNDHFSIYCELVFPIQALAESEDEVKFNFVWEVSDDQLESYGDILDNFSFEIWSDFLLCNIVVITPWINNKWIIFIVR